MPRVGPFAIVRRFARDATSVADFGFVHSDRPAERWHDPEFEFTGFALEPQTNSIIVSPRLEIEPANDFTRWIASADWMEAFPSGFPEGRRLLRWTWADPARRFAATSRFEVAANEPFVWEFGLLPSAATPAEHQVILSWGSGALRLVIEKRRPVLFQANDGGTWKVLAELPLDLRYAWRDLQTEMLWVVPYWRGLLFATSPEPKAWHFVRPREGLDSPRGTLSIEGSGGVAIFGVHRVRFEAARLRSAEIDPGGEPSNAGRVRVDGWIEDLGGSVRAFLEPASPPTYRYVIEIEPGRKQIGIAKVDVIHDPQLIVVREADPLTVSRVLEVNEQVPENPADAVASVMLDDEEGLYRGRFQRHEIIDWAFGWLHDDGRAEQALRGTGTITGITEVRLASGEARVELTLRPLLQTLREGSVIFAPDYTGWKVPDALRDFLVRQGIPQDRISIDDRWDDVALPPGGEPGAWQPAFGTSSWKWLSEFVEFFLGGWLVSLADGTVRIEPYPEAEDWPEAGEIFHLTESDLVSLRYGRPEEALQEVRNIVVVMGLDPFGFPLAAVMRDEGSLYDPSAPNFVGYPRPLVLRDAGLTSQEIVNWVASALYNRFRKVRETIEFEFHPRRGDILLAPGDFCRLLRPDGDLDMIIVRAISTRLAHGELSQQVLGHYERIRVGP